MSDKFVFTDTYTQTTGSVALGFSNHQITPQSPQSNAPLFRYAIFGVSVSGSSGNFGLNIMGRCPDGTTAVVAGGTATGAVKALFYAANVGGTTQNGGCLRPYEIQYQRAVGTSISYVASVWGILYNP